LGNCRGCSSGELKDAAYYDKVYDDDIINVPAALSRITRWCIMASDWVVGQSILDLGCGLGTLAKYIPIAATYTGVDFSSVAIDYAREHAQIGRDAVFVCGDIIKYTAGLLDQSFDTVVLCEVLEHLADPLEMISQAKRIARMRVVITVPINMPGPGHVWPRWSRGALVKHFGSLLYHATFNPHQIAVWERPAEQRKQPIDMAAWHDATDEASIQIKEAVSAAMMGTTKNGDD